VLVDERSARACLTLAVQADGCEITTVEGLRDPASGALHPIQQAFVDGHGLQCGFCTPGFMMTTLELLRGTPDPSEEQIKEALGGNLCRCTGYQSILDSVKLAAQRMKPSTPA
jgi:carbon-monoxide dehydrogenase small subunit